MSRKVHLSLANRSGPTIVEVVQYSTEPEIIFILDDYLPRAGAISNFYIEKKSGTKIYNACEIDNNTITYQPTTQSFTDLGINKAQLQIVESDGVAISFIILIDVTENIIDSSAIESQDEFTALEAALQTVSSYDGRIVTLEDITTKSTRSGLETRVGLGSAQPGDGERVQVYAKDENDDEFALLTTDNDISLYKTGSGEVWSIPTTIKDLVSGQDLNDIYEIGTYRCTDEVSYSLLNTPINQSSGFILTVSYSMDGERFAQELKYVTKASAARTFRRTCYIDRGWGPWTSTLYEMWEGQTVHVGDMVKETAITTNVPTGVTTNVNSLTLPAGTYIITSTVQWTTSFTNSYNHQIVGFGGDIPDPIVRNVGSGGGGSIITVPAKLTAQRTLYTAVYQATGSARAVNRLMLRAIKLA